VSGKFFLQLGSLMSSGELVTKLYTTIGVVFEVSDADQME